LLLLASADVISMAILFGLGLTRRAFVVRSSLLVTPYIQVRANLILVPFCSYNRPDNQWTSCLHPCRIDGDNPVYNIHLWVITILSSRIIKIEQSKLDRKIIKVKFNLIF